VGGHLHKRTHIYKKKTSLRHSGFALARAETTKIIVSMVYLFPGAQLVHKLLF
jgi:hypothetical protein